VVEKRGELIFQPVLVRRFEKPHFGNEVFDLRNYLLGRHFRFDNRVRSWVLILPIPGRFAFARAIARIGLPRPTSARSTTTPLTLSGSDILHHIEAL
jgi:hypothetical protein